MGLSLTEDIKSTGRPVVITVNGRPDIVLLDATVFERKLSALNLHALLAEDQPYTWTVQVSVKWAINKRLRDVKEAKGWGILNWTPGPLSWWIPRDQRTHDRR